MVFILKIKQEEILKKLDWIALLLKVDNKNVYEGGEKFVQSALWL